MGKFVILIYNSTNWWEYLDIDKEKRRYFRIQNSKNVIIYINCERKEKVLEKLSETF